MRLNRITNNPREFVAKTIAIAQNKLMEHPQFSNFYSSLGYLPLVEAKKITIKNGRIVYGTLVEEDFNSFQDYEDYYKYVVPFLSELFDLIRLIAIGWLFLFENSKDNNSVLVEEFEMVYDDIFIIPEIKASVVRKRNRKAAQAKSPAYYVAQEIYKDLTRNEEKISAKKLLNELEKKGYKAVSTSISRWLTEFKKNSRPV